MRTAFPLALLWIVTLPFSAAMGREIYVNNLSGDDTFSGQQPDANVQQASRGGPVRSINKALHLARQGDHIVLANTGVPYRECLSLEGSAASGLSLSPFVIDGHGAVLDGSAPVPPGAWENYQGPVFRFRPPRLGHQQLFIHDRPAPRVAVSRLTGAPPDFEPLEWCLQSGYIYFCVEWDKLPQDYALTFAEKQTGITLFHVQNVVITDLTVQGFQLDGVNAQNSARDVLLRGVTCRGNGRAGITVGGASLVQLDGCSVGDNGVAQLLTLPWSETHVTDSTLLSNTAPAIDRQGGRVYVDGKPLAMGTTGVVE